MQRKMFYQQFCQLLHLNALTSIYYLITIVYFLSIYRQATKCLKAHFVVKQVIFTWIEYRVFVIISAAEGSA